MLGLSIKIIYIYIFFFKILFCKHFGTTPGCDLHEVGWGYHSARNRACPGQECIKLVLLTFQPPLAQERFLGVLRQLGLNPHT